MGAAYWKSGSGYKRIRAGKIIGTGGETPIGPPADGKAELYITLTTVTGLSPTLYLNKSDASEMTIDWGDEHSETTTSDGNFSVSHTYSSAGDYVIKLSITSGSGTYSFGNGSDTTVCVGGATAAYKDSLTKILIGDGATALLAYAFNGCRNLSAIYLPSNIISLGVASLAGCIALRSLTVPSSISTIPSFFLQNAYSLASLTLSEGILAINSYALSTDFGSTLTALTIPSTVTSIGNYAFAGQRVMKKYTFLPTTPPTISAVSRFGGISPICKIKVPSASLSAYQTATYWSTYAAYMEGY